VFRIDDFPFPKGEPDAIELMNIMADLYGDRRAAVRLVARFGVEERRIPPGLEPINLWDFLLNELAKNNKVRECIQAVRNEYSNNAHVPFLDKLLKSASG
jgi:hypothetical protein